MRARDGVVMLVDDEVRSLGLALVGLVQGRERGDG